MPIISAQPQRPDPRSDSVYDPARLVVTEEGRVVYASPSFAALIHAVPAAIKGARLFDLMVFPAFHGAATQADPQHFGLHSGACRDIPNGRHSVVVPDFGPPLITFFCEWMQVGEGPRFLVLTRAEDDEQADPMSRGDRASRLVPGLSFESPRASERMVQIPDRPMPQVVDFSSIGERDIGGPDLTASEIGDVFVPTVDEAIVYLDTVACDDPDLVGLRHTDAFDHFAQTWHLGAKRLVPNSTAAAPIAKTQAPPKTSLHQQFRKLQERGTRAEAHVFMDLSDDVMMRVALNGRIQSVNQAGIQCFGTRAVQTEGKTVFDLVIPDDRERVAAVFMNFAHDPGLSGRVAVEARMVDHIGAIRIFDMRLRRLGERIFVLAHDLTEARAREQKLAHHAAQLAEAESIAHLGYWRWAVGSDCLVWSEEMYRIFELDPALGAPRTEDVIAQIAFRDRQRVVQAIERALFQTNAYQLDFQIRRVNGGVRYIRCEGRCEADSAGDIVALFGTMQDVTERKVAESELIEAKNAAERAYASKSKFLANMSHELRTPLNAIIGFSEMIQRQLLGPLGNDRYLDYIDGIRASGEHLLDLISDILDMSKIEAGKYTIDPEDVNMAKLVRLAVNMVEGRAREAQVVLVADVADDTIHAMADRRAVLQMILNLLSNAVKFTKAGGTVTVRAQADEKYVTLSVSDTGIGIPAHLIPTITKPFEQVANHYTRSHDGSGLGLAITKELAQLHGGDVAITSKLGVGTTVSFTILKERP